MERFGEVERLDDGEEAEGDELGMKKLLEDLCEGMDDGV